MKVLLKDNLTEIYCDEIQLITKEKYSFYKCFINGDIIARINIDNVFKILGN